MICKHCNYEFNGKFCPKCGAKIEGEANFASPPVEQQPLNQQTFAAPNVQKKKKPLFLRWWFITIAVILALFIGLVSLSGNKKVDWEEMVLGDMLPEPPTNKGYLYENTSEELYVNLDDVTDKEFSDYIEGCKEKGFTVDAKTTSDKYTAYNSDGYSLTLSHYSDLSITLKAPIKMSAITWPTSQAGKQLPLPKSTLGNFSHEQEDGFFVYIGNTSKADYDLYVKACSNKGFAVDYDKGENYYNAKNKDGWSLRLEYLGNNIMSIDIDAPSNATYDYYDTTTTTPSTNESKPAETTQSKPQTTNGLSADFKAAMDSYEKFMDEYVAFMKKYKANPTDLGLLSDYADYMSKYSDFVSDFNKWDTSKMSTEEVAYYIDVQSRVNKKLLEVAE